MASCVKCNLPVNLADSVKCIKCSDCFHYSCAGLDATRKPTRKNTFRCGKCSGPLMTANNSDCEDIGGNLQVLNAISGLKSDFKDMLDSKLENVEKKISDKMETSFASVQAEISEVKSTLQESIDTLKKENAALKGSCQRLENDLRETEAEMRELKFQMQDMQQYSRLNNIEIVGVPLTKNEDIYAIIEKIANSIDVPWLRSDISVAHRLPSNQKNRHPNIVVRFISRTTRASWLAAAKLKRGLDAVHLSSTLAPSPIFINEHLTAHTKSVLSMAKRMVRERLLAFAWVKEGRVLVRVTVDARPRRVGDITDLEKVARSPRPSHGSPENLRSSQASS